MAKCLFLEVAPLCMGKQGVADGLVLLQRGSRRPGFAIPAPAAQPSQVQRMLQIGE
jgi:hypothetical protein